MNSKIRVQKAVNFEKPDRVPIIPEVFNKRWLACSDKDNRALVDYLNSLPMDRDPVILPRRENLQRKEKKWKDAWSCVWEEKNPGEFGTVTGHPLADWNNFDSYTFPELIPKKIYFPPADSYYKIVNGADIYGVLWYMMQFLRSYEEVMVDLAADLSKVHSLRDGVLKVRLAYLKEVLKMYPDCECVYFGDCWGVQNSLMINPAQWREVFKPAYKQLFDVIHAGNKKVFFQSDGYTFDIIKDLLEIGVDIIRVSVGMMDIPALGNMIRGKACLYADPCRQHIMPKGSTTDVKKHIKDIIKAFATPEGGLIGTVCIDEDVPLDNIKAAYDTYLEYGKNF